MGYHSLNASMRALGFSLIELLGCISISATLLFSVIPQLDHMLTNAMLENRVNSIHRALKEAKLAAIKYNSEVVICSLQSKELSCADDIDSPDAWSRGWIVFEDRNSNKRHDDHDRIILSDRFDGKQCQLSWNRGGSLSYHRFGVLKGAKAGSFKITCGKLQTQLIINWVGRVRRKSERS